MQQLVRSLVTLERALLFMERDGGPNLTPYLSKLSPPIACTSCCRFLVFGREESFF